MTGYSDNFNHTRRFSDTVCQLFLAEGTAQTYTVPGNATQKYRAVLTWNSASNIFVGLNATAAAPSSGDQTTTAGLEFKPREAKYCQGGDVFSMLTPDSGGAYMGIALLAISG